MKTQILFAAALLAATAVPAFAAKPPSDAERLRQQAEHVCYADVQKLCNADIPDEDKIKSCMASHHAELSPPCAAIYDKGLGG